MKIGLFGMPLHPADRNRAEAYAADAERVILADQLGYDEVFIGEHQSCTTEPIASPLIFLAASAVIGRDDALHTKGDSKCATRSTGWSPAR